MQMPGRKITAGNGYRYGFNGKELDKDISADAYDYGMRISDQRLGRFLSVDPITDEYPELTPYQFSSNTPVSTIDLDGLESVYRMPDGSIYRHPYGPSDRLRPPPPPPGAQLMGIERHNKVFTKENVSLVLDFIPLVGQVKSGVEVVTGEDLITKKEISTKDRIAGLVPYVGKAKKVVKVVKAADKVDDVKKVTKAANKVDDAKSTEKAIVKIRIRMMPKEILYYTKLQKVIKSSK